MKCAQVMEWTPLYLRGTLGPAERRLMERHFRGCGGCQAWLEESRELDAMWSGMEAGIMPSGKEGIPDLTQAVLAEIGKLEQERRSQTSSPKRLFSPRSAWMHYGIAACLTVLLVQWGVFENLAYGITEINVHMSSSVTSWFGR